jgi:hypothetical protein
MATIIHFVNGASERVKMSPQEVATKLEGSVSSSGGWCRFDRDKEGPLMVQADQVTHLTQDGRR